MEEEDSHSGSQGTEVCKASGLLIHVIDEISCYIILLINFN